MAADGTVVIDSRLDTRGAEEGLGKLKGVLGGAGKVLAGAFVAVTAGIVGAGTAIWKMAKETAAAGDRIDEMSQTLGVSKKAFQEWEYVLGQNGTDIEALKVGMNGLNNSVDDAANGGEKAAEKFKRLGISIDDLKGKSREEIFKMTVDGLQGVTDKGEKAAIASDLFGKSAVGLATTLNMTKEETDAMIKKAHELGIVMSDEDVAAAGKFNDSMDTLKATFTGLKRSLVSELMPSLLKLSEAFTGLLAGQEGSSEKIKAAASELMGSLKGVLVNMVDVLMSIVTSVVEIAPAIIKALVEGIVSNLPLLVTAAASIVMTLIDSIVTALPQIVEGAGQLVDTLVQGIIKLLPNLLKVGMEILITVIKGIAKALPTLIPQLVKLVLDIAKVFIDNLPMLLDAGMQLLKGLADGIIASLPLIAEMVPQLILSFVQFITDNLPMVLEVGLTILMTLINGIIDNLPTLMEAIIKIIPVIIEALIGMIPQLIEVAVKFIPALIEGMIKALPMLIKYIPEIIWAIVVALANGLVELNNAGTKALKDVWDGIKAWAPTFWENFKLWVSDTITKIGEWFKGVYDSGVNLVKGLWQGIKDNAKWLWDQIADWANGILKKINSVFGIQSPSKEMAKIGGYMGDGFIKGFQKKDRAIQNSLGNMSDETLLWGDTLLTGMIEQYDTNLEQVAVTVESFTIDATTKFTDMLNAILTGSQDILSQVVSTFQTRTDEIKAIVRAMVDAIKAMVQEALAALAALNDAQASASGLGSGGGGSSGGGYGYETDPYPEGQYWTIDPAAMSSGLSANNSTVINQTVNLNVATDKPSIIAKALRDAQLVK